LHRRILETQRHRHHEVERHLFYASIASLFSVVVLQRFNL